MNLRLQAVSVVVYVAFEMGLFKGPKCCPRGVYRKATSKNNRDMLLQIVNRCLSAEITALAIGFRLRAFYDRREKIRVLATYVLIFQGSRRRSENWDALNVFRFQRA